METLHNFFSCLFWIVIILLLVLFISFVLWCCFKHRYIVKEKEKCKKEANEIIAFCKAPHNFREIRDELYKIAQVSYTDLFKLDFSIDNITDDTQMTIFVYRSEDELQNILYNRFVTKIGILRLKDKECENECLHD